MAPQASRPLTPPTHAHALNTTRRHSWVRECVLRPAAGLEHHPSFRPPLPGLGSGLPPRPPRGDGGAASPDAAAPPGTSERERAHRRAAADAARGRVVSALVTATESFSWSLRLYLARAARAARLDGGRLEALAPLLCAGLEGAVAEYAREAGDANRWAFWGGVERV